jgi:hypothetical protein
MAGEEFINRYDENVKPERFLQKELPNVLEVARELNLV